MKVFDKPIVIQKFDEEKEQWNTVYKVHASINKTRADNEYLNGGAIQYKNNLTFEVRYFAGLNDISLNMQRYRVLYNDVPYDITDYDDFMSQHKTIKLSGVSYSW